MGDLRRNAELIDRIKSAILTTVDVRVDQDLKVADTIQPVIFLDDSLDGTLARLQDITTKTETWLEGDAVGVKGTYTRTGGAGIGRIDIAIADGDYGMVMYGNSTVGAVKAGAGDHNINLVDGDGDTVVPVAINAAATVNQVLNLLGLGQTPSAQGRYVEFSADIARMMEGGYELRVTLNTMVNDEVFAVNILYWSRGGIPPVVTATGGDFV